MTIDEIKRRLVFAMDLAEPTDDWLEQAEKRLYAYANARMQRRIYDVSTVGARVRTAREVIGLTQPQLAARLGVHPLEISKWERGKGALPAKRLPGLCACVGVSKAWMLGESTEGGPRVPERVMRRQFIPGWREKSANEKLKFQRKAELQRLRGLRPQKPTSYEDVEPMSSAGSEP